MRYETAASFRQALEQRLLDRSRADGTSPIRLRKTVVFDRVLARLVQAAPDRWVLKGALALDLRRGHGGRATKDMDMVRHDDAEAATEDLQAAAAVDLGDFFSFWVERIGTPTDEAGAAVRFRVRAELAGRLFEEVSIDVGFSDPLRWRPETLPGPDLLSFADIPPVQIPAIPLEQQIAEKVHAYTRTYASGAPSSRVKDLIDLVIVALEMSVDARRLREALEVTFQARDQQPLPSALPPPPGDWTVPYGRAAREVGIDPDPAVGHAVAAALLNPVLSGEAEGRWEPALGDWVT